MLPSALLTLLAGFLALAHTAAPKRPQLPDLVAKRGPNWEQADSLEFVVSHDTSDGFTMIIATYRREHVLQKLLNHLTAAPPRSLRHILVVWQDVDASLPDYLQAAELDKYATSGVVVHVRKSERNSMNERFRPMLDWDVPIPTKAVMIMDDDVVLLSRTLEWGYQRFVEANKDPSHGRLTGFAPRDYAFETNEETGERTFKYVVQPRMTYSMILSNAAWLRTEWLEAYWADTPKMAELRDVVDHYFNCDDLLINFVVSNLTHEPPLLLQPSTPLRTVPTTGLWNREVDNTTHKVDHWTARPLCLSRFFDAFSDSRPNTNTNTDTDLDIDELHPLVRTSSSVSEDVKDRSRWLYDDERWSDPSYKPAHVRRREEAERFEMELERMSEDELEDVIEAYERQFASTSAREATDEALDEEEDDERAARHDEL